MLLINKTQIVLYVLLSNVFFYIWLVSLTDILWGTEAEDICFVVNIKVLPLTCLGVIIRPNRENTLQTSIRHFAIKVSAIN